MKTPFLLVAAVMAGVASTAPAQDADAAPSATPAPAATQAPLFEIEAPATAAADESEAPDASEASEMEAEPASPPEKLDPEVLSGQTGDDEQLFLIPGDIAPVQEPDPALLSGGKEGAEKAGPLKKGTAEQLRQAIRIRELKTVANEDPEIVAQLERADKAVTYEGRRVALRNYYALLTARMIRLDPSLKEVLEADLRRKLADLEQRRVRPSKLIEPINPLPGSRSADYAEKKQ